MLIIQKNSSNWDCTWTKEIWRQLASKKLLIIWLKERWARNFARHNWDCSEEAPSCVTKWTGFTSLNIISFLLLSNILSNKKEFNFSWLNYEIEHFFRRLLQCLLVNDCQFSSVVTTIVKRRIGKVSWAITKWNQIIWNYLYIFLEKINVPMYFEDIVIKWTYFMKSNDIFWKPVKFYIILHISIFIQIDI